MKVNELNAGQGNVEVEGVIKEVGEPRTFNKFGRELTVVNAILEDDSGNIKLSLWNDDATRFKVGDKVKVVNGYVSEFQGEPQLTAGKFGKIQLLGEGEASSDSGQSELPSEEAPVKAEEASSEDAEAPVEESGEKSSDGQEEF